MPEELSLADLNARLLGELAQAAIAAERTQRDAYLALAEEAAVPLDEARARAAGVTDEEQFAIAARYIAEVLDLPGNEPVIAVGDATLQRLIQHLPAVERDIETTMGSRVTMRKIQRAALEKHVTERLRHDAEERWRNAVAVLRAGMPKAQMNRGTLTAKVLLREDDGGRMTARLATAETLREASEAAISTITIDFAVGAFPPFEA